MFLYAGMPIGCQLGHFDPIFVQSSHAFNSAKLFHCIAALEIILKEMEVVALLYLQTFFAILNSGCSFILRKGQARKKWMILSDDVSMMLYVRYLAEITSEWITPAITSRVCSCIQALQHTCLFSSPFLLNQKSLCINVSSASKFTFHARLCRPQFFTRKAVLARCNQ